MRIQDAILYGSKGGSSPSGSIEISENGTYDVTEKASAVVDVEPDLTTKQITQNGTYSASSDNVDGYSAVTVAVPQPSGKITILQNGTDIDVSGYALADVNVPSNEDAIINRSINVNYVNNSVTSIGNNAFNGCYSLTKVNFQNVTSIGNNAFTDCIKLTEANFPNATSIGGTVFSNCSSLTEANFPNATSIGNYAFNGCSKLTEVDFQNATSIGISAFNGCNKLASLILRKSTDICTLYNKSAFNGTPIASGTGYIYVPAALIDSYKAATNWSTYAAQFRALEDYTVDGTTTGDLDPTKI